VTISSPHNERIKAVRRLQRAKGRREAGKTLLEGPHLLEAALAAGIVPDVVFVAAGAEAVSDAIEVSDAVLDAIAPTETPRGPIAVVDIPDPAPLQAHDTFVLWDVSDPGNAGTLIRSAAGFGWNVAIHGGVDVWSPKVLRAGAGAHFAVPVSAIDDVGDLAAAGLAIVATVPVGGVDPHELAVDGPIALLVGNEAAGLPTSVVDAADALLTIPAFGLESLNAAVAGSIAMYAVAGRV
jgi:RNA methyltransferase, TrmH family